MSEKWNTEQMKRRAAVDRFAWWCMVIGVPAGILIGFIVVLVYGGFN